ncbi:hypothetical protein ACFQ22_11020 [Lentilactobacillus raoultii]|uniref:ASCH domain-containing protein n=1 Tax=Lentilactobacillus raoultii TaxID=1987503 RepID=A0ABW3PVB5_9LACO
MKALSIKQPYAWQIIIGQKPFEYRSWLPGKVTTFLLVSAATPSATDFGWGLANGLALAIISIGRVSREKHYGNYAWPVQVVDLVKPFPVKGRLHFYEVDDAKITRLPDLTHSLLAYRQDQTSDQAIDFINQYQRPLMAIGYRQMPKKYQKQFEATKSWQAVRELWLKRHAN